MCSGIEEAAALHTESRKHTRHFPRPQITPGARRAGSQSARLSRLCNERHPKITKLLKDSDSIADLFLAVRCSEFRFRNAGVDTGAVLGGDLFLLHFNDSVFLRRAFFCFLYLIIFLRENGFFVLLLGRCNVEKTTNFSRQVKSSKCVDHAAEATSPIKTRRIKSINDLT